MELSEELVALLRTPALCYVATVMPDGSPQLTQTWVDTDGRNLVINIVEGMQKARNLERDTRVAVAVSDPAHPVAYTQVRGRVVEMTSEGGEESIDALAHKYTGKPYAWYGGREQTRLVVTIEADRITSIP
ncbi:PPOX class F420-dependent oxidoreductase [Nocardioides mangrovicus]|uniref:PPOX class F420-dependent oxidoreductase n=1 Tax=Nocardioides mangrovicus TaxID=2478913 RepID=A0A3L8P1Y0_9ACTN|nr:PPOX class F420-dependent oxidoreductase [Nocardioides mangrovicus]RLV49051.1 PPOX class F420-dependent oxidoreductase [Nocardioides mangrovicus]